MSEFAHRARIDLGIEQAPRGRGSGVTSRDRYYRAHILAAVSAAKINYPRGDIAFRIASRLLELQGMHRNWDSLKATYFAEKKRGSRPDQELVDVYSNFLGGGLFPDEGW